VHCHWHRRRDSAARRQLLRSGLQGCRHLCVRQLHGGVVLQPGVPERALARAQAALQGAQGC